MSAKKLEKLANTKFDIKAAKLALLERVDAHITFTWNGGLFKATPALIAYITGLINYTSDTVIILDEYKNPIRIKIEPFLIDVVATNQYALNTYRIQYNKLKKVRKGDKL